MKVRLRPPAPKTFAYSDTGNAEYVIEQYGQDLRWHKHYKAWIHWDADLGFWRTLDQPPFPLVAAAMRQRATRALQRETVDEKEVKWLLKSEARNHMGSCLSVARSFPEIQVGVNDWNLDADVLAVANGIVNLKTGGLRRHRRDDFISMRCPHLYKPDAKCPRFRRFLTEVFGENASTLVPWVKRAVGYSLTGQTGEHKFFLPEGDGRNGKSTFLGIVSYLLGGPRVVAKVAPLVSSKAELRVAQALPGYAYILSFTALQKKKFGGAESYALAALPGRRFVAVTEAEKGARWNEAVLKRLTGGDAIQVRGIYSAPFEFVPAAKFWVAVNDLPETDDFSKAFWARVCVIPFHEHFKENLSLAGELMAEIEGILAWAVEGAVEWYRDGLGTNRIVDRATKQYRRDVHPLADFLHDRVRRIGKNGDPGPGIPLKKLYERYLMWATGARVPSREQLSRHQFATALTDARFEKTRTAGVNRNQTGFIGLEFR